MKLLLPLLFALSVSAFSLFAESPASPALNVRIEVQMVAMPLEKGLPLLPNLLDAGSIDGAFSQIQKMIATGEATLVGWPQVVTKSGQRAVAEDIEEIRYASEFNGSQKPAASAVESKKAVPGGAPVPSGNETRNAGVTLEVEPVVSPDGKTIDINLVPQHVRLLHFDVMASGHDENGNDWAIKTPRFFTAKTTTSLTVATGKRVLLANFRGPEGSDYIEFFILKVDVLPVDVVKSK